MTASTGRVFGPKPYGGAHALPHALRYRLALNVAPFRNWLLGINAAGFAVAQAPDVVGLVSAGFSDDDQPGGASNGAADFIGRQQFVSGFPNSTQANDAILASDIAVPCWAVDNQTVGKKSNHAGVNRSLLGVAFGRDADNGDTPIILPGPIGWLLGRSAHIADAMAGAEYQITDAAASTTTAERAIPRKKIHGTVTAIEFIGAAVAEDDTDYATITVSKRDGAGGGAVVLGTYDTRDANQGAITAFVPAAFSLSAVAGALNLLETDVVTATVTKGGSGKTLTGAIRVIQKVA